MSIQLEDMLSEAELCERLGISRATAYRLRREGRLGAYRVADRVLFSERQIRAFLQACEEPTNTRKEEKGATN